MGSKSRWMGSGEIQNEDNADELFLDRSAYPPVSTVPWRLASHAHPEQIVGSVAAW